MTCQVPRHSCLSSPAGCWGRAPAAGLADPGHRASSGDAQATAAWSPWSRPAQMRICPPAHTHAHTRATDAHHSSFTRETNTCKRTATLTNTLEHIAHETTHAHEPNHLRPLTDAQTPPPPCTHIRSTVPHPDSFTHLTRSFIQTRMTPDPGVFSHIRSLLCRHRHTLLSTQPPAHPAQLGHAGHVERGLGVFIRIVLPEEVIDFVIIGLVLVHNGSLDELGVCQRHGQTGVRLGVCSEDPPLCAPTLCAREHTHTPSLYKQTQGKSDLEEKSEHQVQ